MPPSAANAGIACALLSLLQQQEGHMHHRMAAKQKSRGRDFAVMTDKQSRDAAESRL
ncbi:MAG: hypothetical protein MPK06_02060 [Alphaproteobacteria bacterium]|nr:hypothetical protein [Alphaproteobacteria bacterium]MDA8003354.1 hypothetical protein [Alphaproteobacteria bacterium]MDA8005312.1 hypothetical protein [Alphaproteobacteria bacterium]MDA8012739.1 hypothetical protein [Alphaproteobacteria bacterium]